MKASLQQAIVATLAYADIFDYPLTDSEVWYWLIHDHLVQPGVLQRALKLLPRRIVHRGTFYILSRRKNIIAIRKQRQKESAKKWRLVAKIIPLLRIIPTVVFIGVTGSLAMDNADIDDDIDLCIITSNGTLWTTRLLVAGIIELTGHRRHPNQKNVRDCICLNMFMTEQSLILPMPDRDVYASHEVLQMRPVWDRGGVYQKFLHSNRWVKSYLPHAWDVQSKRAKQSQAYVTKKSFSQSIIILFCVLLEPVAQKLEYLYMQRKRTAEIISPNIARFHPRDARVWVARALQERLHSFGIPLDKVFYSSLK